MTKNTLTLRIAKANKNTHKANNNKDTTTTLWLERVYSKDSRFVSSKVYAPRS